MAIKVKPWDVGVIPRIIQVSRNQCTCEGGGVKAYAWTPRSAYIIWQKGRELITRADRYIASGGYVKPINLPRLGEKL